MIIIIQLIIVLIFILISAIYIRYDPRLDLLVSGNNIHLIMWYWKTDTSREYKKILTFKTKYIM
jgi:hypothetical protein